MTPEEREALRLAEEAAANNPITQPTDLIGQQGQQETGDTNPLLTAGLGLNRAVEAGEDPAVAAARLGVADTAIRGLDPSNRKVDFMSDGTGVLNGVSLFTGGAEDTGNNYSDVVNADNARREAFATGNVYPTAEQPQDIQPVKTVVPTEQAGSENLGLFSTGGYFNFPTGQPSQVAQPTQLDIFNRRVAAGEDANQVRIDLGVDANFGREPFIPGPSVEDVILEKQARGSDATYIPEELKQITSIQGTDQANNAQFVQDYQNTQMDIAKSLQNLSNVDDLRAVEAELAARGINRDFATPFQQTAASLAEANASSSFTPRSTFISNGKYIQEDEFGQRRELTPEQYNAFQSNMAELGQPTQTPRPMGRDDTRARLGGRTLSEYLNAPNGTEGVSGLRTDAQGRMIPGGFETRADAYRSYEDEAAAREGRLAARMQQPDESITERDTRIAGERTQSSQNVPTDVREAMLTPEGRRTAKQINRLARWSGSTQGQEMGGVAGLERSLQPVDAQKQQYDAMRVYKLGLEIDKMQQEKPSEYQEAAAEVDEAIAAGSIKPEDRNKFILRDLGWQAKEGEDSSDLMSIIYGNLTDGDGGVFSEAQESSISKVMAANPGSSREQVIAEMKKQGKL